MDESDPLLLAGGADVIGPDGTARLGDVADTVASSVFDVVGERASPVGDEGDLVQLAHPLVTLNDAEQLVLVVDNLDLGVDAILHLRARPDG